MVDRRAAIRDRDLKAKRALRSAMRDLRSTTNDQRPTNMGETMKKTFLILSAMLFTSTNLLAQDWAKARVEHSPRHREWVNVKNGTRTVSAFVVYPESKAKATAVVVIHEIFGMSDWVQLEADELAAAGYIAIAPDLLSGVGPKGGGTSDFAADNNAI